jgi:hypothetical protein
MPPDLGERDSNDGAPVVEITQEMSDDDRIFCL